MSSLNKKENDNLKNDANFNLQVKGSISPFLLIIIVFVVLIIFDVKIDTAMFDSLYKFFKLLSLYK